MNRGGAFDRRNTLDERPVASAGPGLLRGFFSVNEVQPNRRLQPSARGDMLSAPRLNRGR
jgi:hypothetical protein